MKFNEWIIKDHFPEKNLQDIEPISIRAYSLVSRNSKVLGPKEGAPNLLGALEILEALDYHFNNFMELRNSDNSINQKHEAVAYLNRLGQLYYFSKSNFIKQYNSNPRLMLPKVNELIILRGKNTAHRSLDSPRGEPLEYRNRQAISFLGSTIRKFLDDEQFAFPNYLKDKNETEWIYFTPAIDHPIIMKESYELIEKIITRITNLPSN